MKLLRTLLSARLILILLVPFALNSQVQAEVIIQGLNSHKTSILKAKLDALFQGYFKAVAADDKESALAEYYPWQKVRPENMPEKINEALLGVSLIKQQIDANKGIKNVEVLRVAAPDGFSEADERKVMAKVILQVEFNNGFKDISGVVDVTREYYENLGWGDDWKLGRDFKFSLPLVGMKTALKTVESYYSAAVAGDAASIEKMTYSWRLLQKPGSTSRTGATKELTRDAASMKMIVLANGGIKNIEVKDVFGSKSEVDHSNSMGGFNKNYQALAAINVNYSIHYKNGKTEDKRDCFVLDKGQWKILKI